MDAGATPVAPVPVAVVPADATPGAPADATFQLAAYRDGELRLHLLGEEVFVSGAAGLARFDAGSARVMAVEYGVSGQAAPEFFDDWSTEQLGGVWPDNAWLTTTYGLSRSVSPVRVHRREGNFWKLQDNKDGILYWDYVAILNWHSGQVLGLKMWGPDPAFYEDGGEATPAVEKKISAAMKRVHTSFEVLGPKPTPTPMVYGPGISFVAAAAAPTGEVFVLGRKPGRDPMTPRVQRWGIAGEAAVAGTIDVLPDNMGCEKITVRAADEAYVACSRYSEPLGPYLTRFDGTVWTEEPGPDIARSYHDLSVAPDGALVVVFSIAGEDEERRVARRSARGAAWEVLELPALRFPDRNFPEWAFYPERQDYLLQPADPVAAAATWPVQAHQVLARPGGEVWVAGWTGLERGELASFNQARNVVLRSGKLREPLRMLPDGDLSMEVRDWRPAEAWTPKGCMYVEEDRPAFVEIRTLPRDAPRNAPEPMLAEFVKANQALMGQVARIVEVFHRGRRTTGLYVRPSDQAGADALLAAIARVAPDEERRIECRMPRIRREFDKTTGQALQAPAI